MTASIMINYDKNLQIYFSSLINDEHFLSGFGTKATGDAREIENRIQYFEKHNISYESLVNPIQKHSTNIRVVEKSDEIIQRIENTDGLITKEKNIVLTIYTADCVPIIFVDKKQKMIGISHQGWKGTYDEMATKMVEKMIEQGAVKENIVVAIGPSIGPCCYEIYGERLERFRELLRHSRPDRESRDEYDNVLEKRNNKTFLNLALLNFFQLQKAGIPQKNIDLSLLCTSCEKDKFWSYRRDTKEEFGEMFHFVMIRAKD